MYLYETKVLCKNIFFIVVVIYKLFNFKFGREILHPILSLILVQTHLIISRTFWFTTPVLTTISKANLTSGLHSTTRVFDVSY